MSDPTDDTWVLDGADARLDVDRARRTGDPEVVFGQGKTPEQVVEILGALHEAHPDRAVLATRLDDAAIAAVTTAHPTAAARPGRAHRLARAAAGAARRRRRGHRRHERPARGKGGAGDARDPRRRRPSW